MIQLSKIIKSSSVTKRFALGILMLCISTSVLAGGIHGGWLGSLIGEGKGVHTSKVDVLVYPDESITGDKIPGKAYIHYSDFKNFTEEDIRSNNITNHIDYECTQDRLAATDADDIHRHYIRAIPENDYLWDGWYEKGDDEKLSKLMTKELYYYHETGINADPKDDDKNSGIVEAQFLAKWLYPRVESASKTEETITIDNNEKQFESVTFKLKEAQSKDNFDINCQDNGFDIISTTASSQSYPEEITVQIQYTPNGVHTADASDDKVSKGVVTTQSKYHGYEEKFSSKQFTWIVKENYTPSFNVTTICEFEAVPEEQQSTLVASGSIGPNTADWNYAASQGAPISDYGLDPIALEDDIIKNGCIWKIKLENLNEENCFSINTDKATKESESSDYFIVDRDDLINTEQELIIYKPRQLDLAGGETSDKVFEATLSLICTYYDAIGQEIVSEEKNITLRGKVLVDPTIKLAGATTAEIEFKDVIYCAPEATLKYSDGTIVEAQDIRYITNVPNEFINEKSSECEYITITPNRANNEVVTSLVKGITLGDHEAILTLEDRRDNTVSATLTVKANVKLANPVLEGVAGNNMVHLDWSKTEVHGAEEFIVRYTEKDKDGTTNTVTLDPYDDTETDADIRLPDGNGKTYTFTVTARHTTDALENNVFESVSNTITLHPADIPQEIIYASRVTTLFTGTEEFDEKNDIKGKFPYKQKRRIDVSAAFNEEGNALFDYIAIFGLTTSKVEDTNPIIKEETAETPCYWYKRTDNSTYTLQKIKDADSYGMNQSSKHPEFTRTLKSNEKLYITGYCPYASTGSTWSENAVLHITGKASQSFDLYLDNAEIYAKPKDVTITNVTETNVTEIINQWLLEKIGYMQGSGAVIAFTSTDYGFAPKIHLSGNNVLTSTDGIKLNGNATIKVGNKNNTFYLNYDQQSAPIQFLLTKTGQVTKLTIDDIWPSGSRTNGALKLDASSSNAPLIDAGYPESAVSFSGGQIVFCNKNLPLVSYSKYIRTDKSINTDKGTQTNDITIYGATSHTVNSDQGTKATHIGGATSDNIEVFFQDGTFSATQTLNVPQKTIVTGGTYLCDFDRDMYDSYDVNKKKLQKIEIDTKTIIGNNIATLNNGYLIFKSGITGFRTLMDTIILKANWIDGGVVASLASYYNGTSKNYGFYSLTPSEEKIYLMLPKEADPIIKNWVVVGPQYSDIGGNKAIPSVLNSGDDTFGKTNMLLFVDGNTHKIESLNYGLTPSAAINQTDYIVSDKVYIMKPIVATDWMLFCPPFDVANVYIVEAYPEKQLIADFKGENDKVTIKGETNIANARQAQHLRFMDLYTAWYKYNGGDDFYDGKEIGEFIGTWATYESSKGKDGGTPAPGSNYQPVINQLYHYTGHNGTYPEGMKWYDAHYYLYESVGSWTAQNGDYKPTWNVVTTQSGNNAAIMKAGKVYALNFPYNVIGGHNPETTWDYWTGKYIIIESTVKANGHTIPGTLYDWRGIKTIDESTAWMCGNPTFASSQVTDANDSQIWQVDPIYGYTQIIEDPTTGKLDTTICVNSYQMVRQANASFDVYPTRGFVLADPIEPSGMRARTINYQTGEVTYETIEGEDDNDDPGVSTGIPTIMGDVSILVIPTDEGLTIIPREPQQVMLYNAEGKLLFSQHLSAEEHINVPTGAYIVRGEHNQVKAIKK